jgi:hypothetical protein
MVQAQPKARPTCSSRGYGSGPAEGASHMFLTRIMLLFLMVQDHQMSLSKHFSAKKMIPNHKSTTQCDKMASSDFSTLITSFDDMVLEAPQNLRVILITDKETQNFTLNNEDMIRFISNHDFSSLRVLTISSTTLTSLPDLTHLNLRSLTLFTPNIQQAPNLNQKTNLVLSKHTLPHLQASPGTKCRRMTF